MPPIQACQFGVESTNPNPNSSTVEYYDHIRSPSLDIASESVERGQGMGTTKDGTGEGSKVEGDGPGGIPERECRARAAS